MRNETVTELNGQRVVLMDSISLIAPGDRGTIIISGSHGGLISGAFAASQPPRLVLFNDAGGGKNDAGRAAIAMLDRKGIACATIAHSSARIGDAQDGWLSGVVSAVGDTAAAMGLTPGQSVREAAEEASRD